MKLLGSIFRRSGRHLKSCADAISNGIDTGNDTLKNGGIRALVLYFVVRLAVIMIIGLVLVFPGWLNWGQYFQWVFTILGVGVFCALVTEEDTPSQDSEAPITSDVDKVLIAERAVELQDEVRALMFVSIQGASATTPIVRPHEEYDIQPSKASGKCFYLYQDIIPVYQWEADLEGEIDKTQEDNILRELQRYTVKNLPRFPMLMSDEARGRAAVEILDVKNLGGHVQIETVLVNAASIPLVDARRRARAERQVRQERIEDPRYN